MWAVYVGDLVLYPLAFAGQSSTKTPRGPELDEATGVVMLQKEVEDPLKMLIVEDEQPVETLSGNARTAPPRRSTQMSASVTRGKGMPVGRS